MWFLYIIRNADGYRHLSMITENLNEIYKFIEEFDIVVREEFSFDIVKENWNG